MDGMGQLPRAKRDIEPNLLLGKAGHDRFRANLALLARHHHRNRYVAQRPFRTNHSCTASGISDP